MLGLYYTLSLSLSLSLCLYGALYLRLGYRDPAPHKNARYHYYYYSYHDYSLHGQESFSDGGAHLLHVGVTAVEAVELAADGAQLSGQRGHLVVQQLH